jgi:asparagine synthase (glutamine-hydrolysing)
MLDAAVKQWHQIRIGIPDVFGTVRRMIAVHDEPVATATWLSHYLLCGEAAGKGFGSLFGGLGGDELNAGEYEHFFYHFADLKFGGEDKELEYEVAMWAQYHDHPIFRKNMAVVDDALNRLVDIRQKGRCLPERKRIARYYDALNPDYYDINSFKPVMDHPFTSYLKNRTFQDIYRETAPCCLRAEDRQTMAFGLENFLPFFDHHLVEFMFRIPGKSKIRDGITKRLLRQAMKGILPEETRTRIKKTGWNAPAHVWFSGKGLVEIKDLVHSKTFKEHGVYNVPVVKRLMNEHQDIVSGGAARENHMMFFWQLVNLSEWLKWLGNR